MTRTDKLAFAAGLVGGVSLYQLWRNWDTAAALAEVFDPRGTTPLDVERSIRNLHGEVSG